MSRTPIIILVTFIIIAILVVGVYHMEQSPENNEIKSNQDRSYETAYLIGIDQNDFPPFLIHGESKSEITGFDIEIIRWIGDEMKFHLDFVPLSWDALFSSLDAKEVDMIISGVSITPEREKQYLFSDPYLSVSQSIAIHANSTMFLDDFYAGHGIVGVEEGTTSEDAVVAILIDSGILPAENLRKYSNSELGVLNLANESIDFLISDWPVMISFVQKYPIHIIGEIETGESYGIALHKDREYLQRIVNTGLNRLTASPDWDEMKHRYLLDY